MAKYDIKDYRDNYFNYILDLMNYDEHTTKRKYVHLMRDMYEIPYFYVTSLDANREDDGIQMRKRYLERIRKTGNHSVFRHHEVSMLEALAGFSYRFEFEVTGTPGEEDFGKWFWEALENLGLLKYSDSRYDSDAVYEILDNWMNKYYSENGEGSAFPLKDYVKDQRKLDIWMQCQLYNHENYPVNYFDYH